MSGLREALACYLDLRHSLGFTLERDAKLLEQFLAYLHERGSATVTVTDALAWVSLPPGASPGWLRFRMQAVRGFAAYLRTLDPATEIPRCPRRPARPRHHRAHTPVELTPLPGSVIHGRYVRRCPARHRALASATARRVVRSSTSNPTATNRSCTTSARTCPRERSTHSSTLPKNGSINRARRTGPATGRPRSRRSTWRRTVLGSHPANSAAECAHPVKSNASRISITSLMRASGSAIRQARAKPLAGEHCVSPGLES